VVKQSCAGSDFDTQRNKMAASANYGLLSVETVVGEDGKLTFGIKEPTNGTTWLVWDNFCLTYEGQLTDGIEQMAKGQMVKGKCYDLSGRNIVNSKMLKGVYIVNGRKMVVK
jgi:hypothetical protein